MDRASRATRRLGRYARTMALCALLAVLPWSTRAADVASPADPFPRFKSIEPNIRFWTGVWGTWSMGQVVVHDSLLLDVIYEVADLPGPIGESYSQAQRDYIDDLRERWKERLSALEQRVAAGAELTDDDKVLVLNMADKGGGEALTGASDRVRTQRGLRQRFKRGVEISSRYDAEFRRILRDAGLPEDLAILPHVESSFQASARSSAGAVGVWQFTGGAGRRYLSITSAIDERLDPVAAAHGAAGYLTDAYRVLQDWPIALTSYNHGVGGMSRAVAEHGRDYERIFNQYRGRSFGFASRNFYAEFLAARDLVQHPDLFAGEPLEPEPPLDLDSIRLEHGATPAGIARAYGVPLPELVQINPAWTSRAVQRGLALPRNTRVWLPPTTLARLERDGGSPVLPPVAEADPDATYIVRRGDTLSHIAQAHGMRLDELRQINDLADDRTPIRVGQRLRVVGDPDGRGRVAAKRPDASPARTHHTVSRGETLSGIASKHGMTVAQLRDLNGIRSNSSLIRVGQKLTLRSGTDGVHVVRHGDTLLRIAASYRIPVNALLALNQLSLQSLIHPGQTLRIPPES